jgi:hypothetical protein
MQGATVFAMRYLATVVANCFVAFGEILQMHTRLYQLSGGVMRVAQLIAATSAASQLQASIAERNILAAPLTGAWLPLSLAVVLCICQMLNGALHLVEYVDSNNSSCPPAFH